MTFEIWWQFVSFSRSSFVNFRSDESVESPVVEQIKVEKLKNYFKKIWLEYMSPEEVSSFDAYTTIEYINGFSSTTGK